VSDTGWENITDKIGETRTDMDLEQIMGMYAKLCLGKTQFEPAPILVMPHEWEALMDYERERTWTSHMEGDIEE